MHITEFLAVVSLVYVVVSFALYANDVDEREQAGWEGRPVSAMTEKQLFVHALEWPNRLADRIARFVRDDADGIHSCLDNSKPRS